ncbi:MAG: Crp/Fnr family transcriptional regulator [Elusimicrobia bacterium]|nr:Crp/Fnr family transcriptional regulator [Elusimicrobiota bacterium]
MIVDAPLFHGIPKTVLTAATTRCVRRLCKYKDILFQEGQAAHSAFLLRSGLIKLIKSTPQGRPVALEILTSGRLFGGMAVLDHRPYPASAFVLQESEILEIPGPVFEDLFNKVPEFAGAVHREIGQHFRHAQAMRALAQEPVERRVATLLLILLPNPKDEVRMRREDFAELAGCIPETAIRILSDFKKRGLIRTGWKRIGLRNPAGLRARAGIAAPAPTDPSYATLSS